MNIEILLVWYLVSVLAGFVVVCAVDYARRCGYELEIFWGYTNKYTYTVTVLMFPVVLGVLLLSTLIEVIVWVCDSLIRKVVKYLIWRKYK